MAEQLELSTTEEGRPATIRVGLPEHLAKLLGRLEPSARAEIEARLPLLVHQLYESMAAARSLSDEDLAALLKAARADVARYEAETARRGGALASDPLDQV